jgi:hypothetical protein
MTLQRRAHALTHKELEAISRLQEGSPAPNCEDAVWSYLLALDLVWLDAAMRPPTMRLTAQARSYPTE